jgi:hypothetical protein
MDTTSSPQLNDGALEIIGVSSSSSTSRTALVAPAARSSRRTATGASKRRVQPEDGGKGDGLEQTPPVSLHARSTYIFIINPFITSTFIN